MKYIAKNIKNNKYIEKIIEHNYVDKHGIYLRKLKETKKIKNAIVLYNSSYSYYISIYTNDLKNYKFIPQHIAERSIKLEKLKKKELDIFKYKNK